MKLWPDRSGTEQTPPAAVMPEAGEESEGSWELGTVTLISNYKTENSNCKLLQKAKRDEQQANRLAQLPHTLSLPLSLYLPLSLSFSLSPSNTSSFTVSRRAACHISS